MGAADEELMLAYADGDMEAFEVLYLRHKGKVMGYLMARLKDRDEAEEVFQTVFTRLHRARRKYRPEIPFLPWIFTITRNALVDHFRKKQVYRQHITISEDLVAGAVDPRGRQLPAGHLLPDFSGLSADQRQALDLRFFHELSFAEIGEQLQTSAVNARQMVSRAMRTLRKSMQGKGSCHEKR